MQDAQFLDIRDRVLENDPEQGLLGLAFDPDYRANGYFYVNYTTDNPPRSVVSRFTAKPSSGNVADPSSELVLLEVPQPLPNHNGGTLVFGPDGYLYGTFGDGGYFGSHGPSRNSQDLSNLLGTVIRIDVRNATVEQRYRIPPDNPFVGVDGARPEIWAYGLRNPWKLSFDPATGTAWTADAGDVTWEEVDVLRAGANYGWPIREGPDCFPHGTTGCATEGLEPPLFAYRTLPPWCTVIGGHVYRGKRVAGLQGAYVYADFCGLVRAIRQEDGRFAGEAVLVEGKRQITSFGVDEAGELYVLAGRVYHLAARE